MNIQKQCGNGVIYQQVLKTRAHKEVLTSTLKRDEEHMRALTKHAVNNMTNPFEPESHPDVLITLLGYTGCTKFAPEHCMCWRENVAEICAWHT